MSASPSDRTTDPTPDDLHTAEEIAAFLKVDPKTVLNWAKSGIIPEAFRVGRTVRFSLDAVKDSLNVNSAGEGRQVELVVMALSLVFGSNFPRIPKVDLGSITQDEMEQVKKLCMAYAGDLEHLGGPQEQFAYAEGVLAAARAVAKMGELDS